LAIQFNKNAYFFVMPRNRNHHFDTGEIPYSDRIKLALAEYYRANDAQPHSLSMRKAAKQYGISWTTLRDWIAGAKSKEQANEDMQRLSPLEEAVLESWCKQLQD
jgi:transposase